MPQTAVPLAGAHMLREIHEQPAVWREVSAQTGDIGRVARLLEERSPRLMAFAARGSSAHAGIYASYLTQWMLGIPTTQVMPSVHTAWGRDIYGPSMCMVAISQSGSSPDIVTSVQMVRAARATTLAVTNDPSSDLAQAAEVVLPMRAGAELAVAATKSYTASLMVLRLLIGALHGESARAQAALGEQLAEEFELVARASAVELPGWVSLLDGAQAAHVIARGPGLATAREAALKLTETCELTAQGWSAADVLHGPMAAIGPGSPVFCLGAAEAGRASVYEAAGVARDRGARSRLSSVGPKADLALCSPIGSRSTTWR